MKKIATISTNPKRNPIKARFMMGTTLSAIVWGSVHATPLDKAFRGTGASAERTGGQEAAAAAAGPAADILQFCRIETQSR